MATIHFLNVLEGDCNIIQHDSGRVTVIDVSNADNNIDTPAERAKKASKEREEMRTRTLVPSDKKDYGQKKLPDNPIEYLKKLKIKQIFRFIITHPDMDHLDGIQDLLTEYNPLNIWDTENDKELNFTGGAGNGGYNPEDWEYYTKIRGGEIGNRKIFHAKDNVEYFNKDFIKILCPTPKIVNDANEAEEYNDLSYVLLFTPPMENGKNWKILFAGDSDDGSWEYILKNFKEDVSNIDILFAPHHGRDSGRDYEFLNTLNPRVTLFGNASSKHLAYSSYPEIRITNNQAGYVILNIVDTYIDIYVKHFDFARDFRAHRNWSAPVKNITHDAYCLGRLKPKN